MATHLELASIFTVSLTCSRVCLPFPGTAFSFLPPPMAMEASRPVRPRVPKARYSFLTTRPAIMLDERIVSLCIMGAL